MTKVAKLKSSLLVTNLKNQVDPELFASDPFFDMMLKDAKLGADAFYVIEDERKRDGWMGEIKINNNWYFKHYFDYIEIDSIDEIMLKMGYYQEWWTAALDRSGSPTGMRHKS